MTYPKTVRRDTLRKLIEKGNMEARTSYSYDGRMVTNSGDTPWKPLRIRDTKVQLTQENHFTGDWKDGYYNLSDYWLTRGRCTQEGENLWEIWYASEAVEMRVKEAV